MKIKVRGRWRETNAETEAAMKEALERFREHFGRDPGPDDPIFFDEAYHVPVPLSQEKMDETYRAIAAALRIGGVSEDKIYAFEKTKLIPTEDNWRLLSKKDKADWDAAIGEYRAKHKKE